MDVSSSFFNFEVQEKKGLVEFEDFFFVMSDGFWWNLSLFGSLQCIVQGDACLVHCNVEFMNSACLVTAMYSAR
jgi:hypothetical protein